MKLNQKGAVDFIFIAVLVVLLAAGAFTLWRIQAADETVSETAANTANESVSNPHTNLKEGAATDSGQQYKSETTGLSFSYPSTWGEVNEVDLTINCGDESTIGNKYQYTFSNVNSSIILPSSNFDAGVGAKPCLGANDPRSQFQSELEDSQIFSSNSTTTVFADIDSCIGPVKNTFINAIVTLNSENYDVVGLYRMDSSSVNEEDANAYCAGDYEVTTIGLNFDEELENLVQSITVE